MTQIYKHLIIRVINDYHEQIKYVLNKILGNINKWSIITLKKILVYMKIHILFSLHLQAPQSNGTDQFNRKYKGIITFCAFFEFSVYTQNHWTNSI